MTTAQDPADGPSARRDDSPPPQQPPPYTDTDAAAVVELPGDAPEPSAQLTGTQESSQGNQSSQEPERPRIKPEGSAYASAYRPGEGQDVPPAVCVDSFSIS